MDTPYASLNLPRYQAGATAISKCAEIQAQPLIVRSDEVSRLVLYYKFINYN